jgi:hypothetical protein
MVEELLLELTDNEPSELDWTPAVEIPGLDAIESTLSIEYTAIPTVSTTTTRAAIRVGRIGYCSCGRSFLKLWF